MSQITTHILDTSSGVPARQVKVKLFACNDEQWQQIGEGVANADGRVIDLVEQQSALPEGEYKLLFEVNDYFKRNNQNAFFSVVEVRFVIQDNDQHYHVPLLLNPFGYSTYRGS